MRWENDPTLRVGKICEKVDFACFTAFAFRSWGIKRNLSEGSQQKGKGKVVPVLN
jgi:hypothetical protein